MEKEVIKREEIKREAMKRSAIDELDEEVEEAMTVEQAEFVERYRNFAVYKL